MPIPLGKKRGAAGKQHETAVHRPHELVAKNTQVDWTADTGG